MFTHNSKLLGKFIADWTKGLGTLAQISGKTEQVLADAERAVLLGKAELEPVVQSLRAAYDARGNRDEAVAAFRSAVDALRAVEDGGESDAAEAEKRYGRNMAARYQSMIGAGAEVASRTKTAEQLYLRRAVKTGSVKATPAQVTRLFDAAGRALGGSRGLDNTAGVAAFAQIVVRLYTALKSVQQANLDNKTAYNATSYAIDKVLDANKVAKKLLKPQNNGRILSQIKEIVRDLSEARRAWLGASRAIRTGKSVRSVKLSELAKIDWNRARNMNERMGLGATRPPRRSTRSWSGSF